ncbi:MAG: redoxin domain-containing protein [Thermoflavifilum sp.]|nr:redoxin domain-containing protein [Thermoflavifilum sp.]
MKDKACITYIACTFAIVSCCAQSRSSVDVHVLHALHIQPVIISGKKNVQLGSLLMRSKYVLYIFLSPECPLCQNYSKTLNELYQEYQRDSVSWIGIIPGKGFSLQQIQNYKRRFNIKFPLFLDPNLQITHFLHAQVTPQVILMSADGMILYNGAIDNWAVSLGQQRSVVTQHYLQEALESIKHNYPIIINHTNPVGCYINDF